MNENFKSFAISDATRVENPEDFENLEQKIERAKEVQNQISEINESRVVRGAAEQMRVEALTKLYTELLRKIPREIRHVHGLPNPGRYPEESYVRYAGDWAAL